MLPDDCQARRNLTQSARDGQSAAVPEDQMSEKTINLRGLKCPLPALRTRKSLSGMTAGDILIVECTDPLAAIDIPNLVNETGDHLESSLKGEGLLTFRIRKQ
jgi:tRNA 2-thiouridine synthesizing protein A